MSTPAVARWLSWAARQVKWVKWLFTLIFNRNANLHFVLLIHRVLYPISLVKRLSVDILQPCTAVRLTRFSLSLTPYRFSFSLQVRRANATPVDKLRISPFLKLLLFTTVAMATNSGLKICLSAFPFLPGIDTAKLLL